MGDLKFSLLYDSFRNILRVTLISASNLTRAADDDSKHFNPYVTITLQPEYRHLLQSKVQQKNRSPFFNETFEFEVMFSNLYSQTLWFTVFNFLTGSRHSVIGEVVLPLEDLQPSVEQTFSMDLKTTTEVKYKLSFFPAQKILENLLHKVLLLNAKLKRQFELKCQKCQLSVYNMSYNMYIILSEMSIILLYYYLVYFYKM